MRTSHGVQRSDSYLGGCPLDTADEYGTGSFRIILPDNGARVVADTVSIGANGGTSSCTMWHRNSS